MVSGVVGHGRCVQRWRLRSWRVLVSGWLWWGGTVSGVCWRWGGSWRGTHRNVHEWTRERSSFDGLVVVAAVAEVVVVVGHEPAAACTRASSDRIIYFFDNARRPGEWRLESQTSDWLTYVLGGSARGRVAAALGISGIVDNAAAAGNTYVCVLYMMLWRCAARACTTGGVL